MASTSHPTVDAQGRKQYDFKNLTKTILNDIGFSNSQYLAFKNETEQLCGACYTPDAKCSTAIERDHIYQLATTHLFPTWNNVVDSGVQPWQQQRFWTSWMAMCLRTYTKRAREGKWKQTLFNQLAQSTQVQPSLLQTGSVPGSATTFHTAPLAPTLAQAATVPVANANVSTVPHPPPVQAHPAPGAPSLLPAADDRARSLSLRLKSQSPAKSHWVQYANNNAIVWRNVRVRVSFKKVRETHGAAIHPLQVPLIRCTNPSLKDLNEDSVVNATRLDLTALSSLVEDHVLTYAPRSYVYQKDENTICATFGGDSRIKIRDSNDLHQAYNEWVRRRNSDHNDWWLMCIPNALLVDDSDSDIPDDLNAFPSATPKPTPKPTAAPINSDSSDDTFFQDSPSDDDSDDSDEDSDENNDDDDNDSKVLFRRQSRTKPGGKRRRLNRRGDSDNNDDDGDLSDNHTDTDEADEEDDQESSEHPESPSNPKNPRPDPEAREEPTGGPGTSGNGSSHGTHQEDNDDDSESIDDGTGDDSGALNADDKYPRVLEGAQFETYRRGDEEHYSVWKRTDNDDEGDEDVNSDEPMLDHPNNSIHSDDTDLDYNRRHHVRPQRFSDPGWLQAAGFTDSSDTAALDADDYVDQVKDADGDVQELIQKVSSSRALEQFSPEMWSVIAKYLMCPENTRFKLSYRFDIPGANPACYRSPAQMYASIWMKLNEMKIMGGIMADQVGSGKTRTMLASAVADRAYINRMWDDWEDDMAQADDDDNHVRRHLPAWDEQEDNQRCPSADKWRCQCVCERWGVTANIKEKRGPTVVFASASATSTWVDEFRKMFERDDSNKQDRYRNRGFGTKDGFGFDDKQPFRLIICHSATSSAYKDDKYRVQSTDRDLFFPDTDTDTREIMAKRFTDRVVILTTVQSFRSRLVDSLQWRETVEEKTGKKRTRSRILPYPDLLRFGAVLFDEAHLYRTTPSPVTYIAKPQGAVMYAKSNWKISHPYLWLITGTPFTIDVFSDVGLVWGDVWEKFCKHNDDILAWSDKNSWMSGFDSNAIKTYARDSMKLQRGRNDTRSDNEIGLLRVNYVDRAVQYASRLIIQRNEHTRIQGQPTTVLPAVRKTNFDTPLSAQQIELANTPWEKLRKVAQREWLRAKREWDNKGRRGPVPTLERFLMKNASKLPLVRAATSFPELVTVATNYQKSQSTKFDKEDPYFDHLEKKWSDMSTEEKFELSSLRLTVEEMTTKRWDRPEKEKTSPYYRHLADIMDNCHKKDVLDQFWDKVAGSHNHAGEGDKAIVFTCSPASALTVFLYYKYGCGNKDSKFARDTRQMKVELITSGNMTPAEKMLKIELFNGRNVDPTTNKFAHDTPPDILVVTTGTFGTGQNCGRARYALVLEPQPRLALQIQCAGRIRRAGHTERVYVWDIHSSNSTWETVQKARNEDQSQLLQLVQQFERDAENTQDPGNQQDGLDDGLVNAAQA